MADKERKQLNIDLTPEEWLAIRIITATLDKTNGEIIRAHFKQLADELGVSWPDVKRTKRWNSKPVRKSGGE